MRTLFSASLLGVTLGAVTAVIGCPTGPEGCQSASACEATLSTCAGCPDEAATLCVDGACVERQGNAVDVVATVNIDRDVAPQVASLVHVVIAKESATGPLSCAEALLPGGGVAPEANVLAAGYKALSGGSFHEGLSLGRVPEGEVLLVLWGTTANAGEGEIVATGCADGLTATAPELTLDLVQLNP